MANGDKDWHLDKKVNLSIIFVGLCAIFTGIVNATLIWAQVQANTERIAKLPSHFPPVAYIQKMTALETRMEELQKAVERLNFTMRRSWTQPPRDDRR